MNRDKIEFLKWLANRMLYKHLYSPDDPIIVSILETIELLKPKKYILDIQDNDLDKIINQYYADFMLDRCDDMKIGFTVDERLVLRNNIKNIVSDIINKNIPKDFLIKG